MEPENNSSEKVPGCCSQRWLLAYIGFFGFGVVYALRVNLSVAVVCMIKTPVADFSGKNNTWNTTAALPNDEGTCVAENEKASHSNDRAEFDWDSTTKSTLLASFFYGYIVTQIPGGMIADRYGGKRVLLITMFLSSVLTILKPVAARTTVILLYVIRVLLGLLTAVTFPAMHAMWGRWAPPLERSKLTNVCYAGTTLGFAFTFATSGLLCEYGFDNGWGSIFYITGGLGVLWSIAWWYIAADTPSKHPRITTAEVKYINGNIEYNTDRQTGPIPWRSLLSAPCLWATLTAHVCNNWTNYTLLTNTPTFMKEVLKYDIEANGVLSAIPYICQFVSALLAGYIADYIRLKGWLNTTRTRKLFQTISFAGAGGCLIGTGYCTCEERSLAVAMLSLAVMFMGLGRVGHMVNHVDFAPKYAGLMCGITNTMATVPGMVAPIYTGYMTPNHTPQEWRNVFFTCAGFDAFGLIVFLVFASGELQEWAKDSDSDIDIDIYIEIDVTNKNEEINQSKSQKNGEINEGFPL
ncbi:uncharacterized transporter slc-17.2-like isoform X7 [Dreissena polymorpha]|uniref:uncharacterized transporter slc-17.2-like isoform X6 n=1 Tax=Dreissena polymorpha TaxID=45954 RepID=UPI002263E1C4|nr:uncharacterized transporter slc-17.2-like isoform X6 [Dreissena polymorpha]XP_052286763.1 uncharacterized transporter slc-17.2-like isoform X7 [Dreissena polymorpha]